MVVPAPVHPVAHPVPGHFIAPTIGRVVLYHPAGSQPGDQAWPALISYVWAVGPPSLVNLWCGNANGDTVGKLTSICLIQEGDPIPAGGNYAAWMPYQLQASKAQAPGLLAEARAAAGRLAGEASALLHSPLGQRGALAVETMAGTGVEGQLVKEAITLVEEATAPAVTAVAKTPPPLPASPSEKAVP